MSQSKKSEPKIITQTDEYKEIISCLISGDAWTQETLTFKYLKKQYTVSFNYKFYYDRSNGVVCNGYTIRGIMVGTGANMIRSDDVDIEKIAVRLIHNSYPG